MFQQVLDTLYINFNKNVTHGICASHGSLIHSGKKQDDGTAEGVVRVFRLTNMDININNFETRHSVTSYNRKRF